MGTIINAIAIVVATILGIIFKKGLPEKIQKGVMVSLGIGLIALSLGWFLKDFFAIENNTLTTEGDLLIIVSLVIGVIIGEWIDIEETLIFCVGAMAIVGSIKDGLYGDMTTLLIKSALDFVTAMILASVLGIGVIFSAISVLIYQGAITLLAMFGANMLSPEIIHSLSMVGNILLIGIGINFLEIKRIKVANMLPALLIPIIYHLIMTLF